MTPSEPPCDGCIREGPGVCPSRAGDARVDPAPAPLAADERRVWRSDQLLGDGCEAIIEHRGQQYRLRCTKQGKLILYK